MSVIKAEFATFTDAERAFREALRQYERILQTLSADLTKSLAEWDGDARSTYNAAHERWERGAREMHEELTRLHGAIVRAHRNFRSSSSTNVRMWSA
ncbi:WXG100 family type VII secretion target [Actinomadura opuntiae]|uniref:WXG100 family type VII secretion target n=1 Tax=Actinomadura sp. OS1-43 TaxID=604315 RepID=UPI00255AEEFD|nr:WXG100 family type VII secretion target [Actinomadura sp. OS1-43]MDL4820786.1 WXG100 family type VII secretion target [Actinomadura sp. OS1-43]